MPVAFDRLVAEISVGEGRAPVRAKIFDGVKLAVDIEEREFRPVRKFDCRAATRWHVFNATDGEDVTLSLRFLEIIEP